MHWIAWPWPSAEPAPGVPADAAGWWALRFTPRVARLDEALLLEVSSTERLWGGRARLLTLLRQAAGGEGGEGEVRAGGAFPLPRGRPRNRPWPCCAWRRPGGHRRAMCRKACRCTH